MILNPLDTRAGQLMNVDLKALRVAMIDEELVVRKGKNANVLAITEGDGLSVMRLPIFVGDDIVIDIRQMLRAEDKKVTNYIALDRMLISASLMDESVENLDKFKAFYIKSLQVVIGERVRRALMLTLEDLKYLNNLLCIYGLSQYVEYTLEEKVQISKNFLIGEAVDADLLTKAISASVGDIESFDDIFTVLNSLNTISSRLKKLDRDVLIGTLTPIVFGDSVAFLLAGIESPALWMAIIYNHTQERIYSKTQLVNIMKNYKDLVNLDVNMKLVKRLTKERSFNFDNL